jgi:hypothetical protein
VRGFSEHNGEQWGFKSGKFHLVLQNTHFNIIIIIIIINMNERWRKSQRTSVGIVTALRVRRPRNRSSNPGRANRFYCSPIIRPVMGPNQYPC